MTVTITATDVNDAPEFPAAVDSRSVPENSEAGVDIGEPIAATDDDDDTLTYSLDEIAVLLFSIDSGTGQMQVGDGTTLDHETTPSYSVTVSVHDSKDASGIADTAPDATVTVTINVADEDEPPPSLGLLAIAVGGHDNLSVHWQEPATAGIPPITGYGVEYSIEGASDWKSDNVVVNGTTPP